MLYRGSLTTDSGVVLDVAVKMLHPRFAHRLEAFGRRWREQVELFRSLQAPGMVTVRDGFTGPLPHPAGQANLDSQHALYLVMNWVDGEPLEAWAANHPDASPADRLKLLLPIAAALDLAHSGLATGGVPVVHCDIKPANILVTSDSDAVLVDIGLTRVLPGGSRATAVTGTPGYLAPEVLADGRYSPASDRYALGLVAWFLLTGIEPPTTSTLTPRDENSITPTPTARNWSPTCWPCSTPNPNSGRRSWPTGAHSYATQACPPATTSPHWLPQHPLHDRQRPATPAGRRGAPSPSPPLSRWRYWSRRPPSPPQPPGATVRTPLFSPGRRQPRAAPQRQQTPPRAAPHR